MPKLKGAVANAEQQGIQIGNADAPSTCPVCHKGIQAQQLGGHCWGDPERRVMLMMFYCPREECGSAFVALYHNTVNDWYMRGTFPGSIEPSTMSRFIEPISPAFYKIYDQARIAEHHQLSEIAGPGYRKALEFLIKDYLISLDPTDQNKHEKIKAKLLGHCIKEYVSDQRIKDVAARAAWLGNDETHYTRRWEDKDITDLKRLIELTVLWIDLELETKEALDSMPAP